MAKTRSPAKGARKVPKTYRLAPDKVAAAQRVLGAATATETIEQALDLVVFRQALIDGTRSLFGLTIDAPEHG
jgi:hypothetical protein